MAWQDDIAVEVLAEFAGVGALGTEMRPIQMARRGFHIIKTSNRPAPMTDAVINRRHYLRAIASAQCVKCSNPARDGKKTCQGCSDKASTRNRIRRTAMRERMTDLRTGITHHFCIIAKCNKLKCVAGKVEGRDGPYACPRCGGSGIREVDGYLTCNTYEDGRLGEIFIRLGKMGSEENVYEQWAVGASIALQHGVPVEAYFRKFLATQNEPAGATKNKAIPRCTSILDYIARYILIKYVKVEIEKLEEVQP